MVAEMKSRDGKPSSYVYVTCGAEDRTADQILKELDRIARICRANHCRAVLADGAEELCFSEGTAEAFAESSSRARSEIDELAIAFCVDVPSSHGISLAELGTADGKVRVGFFDQRAAALAWLGAVWPGEGERA